VRATVETVGVICTTLRTAVVSIRRQPSRVARARGHIQYHSRTQVKYTRIMTMNARTEALRMGSINDSDRSPAVRHKRNSSQMR